MSQNILYALQQYGQLMAIILSLLGWGGLVTARLLPGGGVVPRLGVWVLQATTGLGLITLLFTVIAALGMLMAGPLLTVIVVGIALYVPQLVTSMGRSKPGIASLKVGQLGLVPSILLFLAVAAFVSNAMVRPLQLPRGWDEVAYHLPTAQAWALSGRLVVTDWLRYPLFPFNMELLYAACLVVANEITAHLVHALTGLLATALTYAVARLYLPAIFSALAAVFLVYAIREPLHTADVDLGLMLYIFSAFATLAFSAMEKRRNLTLLSAFFIGLALGTKYQAMFFLPALAIGFLMVDRNWKRLLLAALVAIATGMFWYVRNTLVAGDPIHPIGGAVFGYWQWNAEDVRRQFMDFDSRQGLPPWYLLLSAGSLLFWRSSDVVVKACMGLSSFVVVLWLLVSGYARYLLPIYPLLALLSGYFLHRLFESVGGYEVVARYRARVGKKAQLAIVVVVLVAIILDWGKSTIKDIRRLVPVGSAEQIAVLREAYPGFELLDSLDTPLYGTLYQKNFEDEIYYLGTPVLGDHFGRARYPDVSRYLGDAAALARHLRALGAVYFMVNLARSPEDNTAALSDPGFYDHFETVSATPRAVLYKLKVSEGTSEPRVMMTEGY